MKKKLVFLLIGIVAAMTVMGGCGSPSGAPVSAEAEMEAEVDDDVEVSAKDLLAATDYDVKKYVKLMDNYMSIPVTLDDSYEVTEAAIQDYIENYVLPSNPMSVPTDKQVVEEGDIANIDYEGKLDGVAFEGGTDAGYNLTIGSHSFIDGFEEGLIGQSVGTTADLNLTFPEDYFNEELAGQEVVFTVTVNSIMEEQEITYDEMTDDYVVAALGKYGLTTVEGLKQEIASSLAQEAESSRAQALQEKVMEALKDGCEVEIPEGILDQRVETIMGQITEAAGEQGAEVLDYVAAYYGYDNMDEFEAYLNETLEEQLIQELILEAAVADQKTSIRMGDFKQFVDTYVQYYGYESEEDFYGVYGGKEMVMLNFAENNMMNQIIENAQVTDAK